MRCFSEHTIFLKLKKALHGTAGGWMWRGQSIAPLKKTPAGVYKAPAGIFNMLSFQEQEVSKSRSTFMAGDRLKVL